MALQIRQRCPELMSYICRNLLLLPLLCFQRLRHLIDCLYHMFGFTHSTGCLRLDSIFTARYLLGHLYDAVYRSGHGTRDQNPQYYHPQKGECFDQQQRPIEGSHQLQFLVAQGIRAVIPYS